MYVMSLDTNLIKYDCKSLGQLSVWLSNQSHEYQCSPKKVCTAETLHFIFIFTPSEYWMSGSQQPAGYRGGIVGNVSWLRWGVTYDAPLISSILHAQNKLRGFQLHSSHALPQCQLSAARVDMMILLFACKRIASYWALCFNPCYNLKRVLQASLHVDKRNLQS